MLDLDQIEEELNQLDLQTTETKIRELDMSIAERQRQIDDIRPKQEALQVEKNRAEREKTRAEEMLVRLSDKHKANVLSEQRYEEYKSVVVTQLAGLDTRVSELKQDAEKLRDSVALLANENALDRQAIKKLNEGGDVEESSSNAAAPTKPVHVLLENCRGKLQEYYHDINLLQTHFDVNYDNGAQKDMKAVRLELCICAAKLRILQDEPCPSGKNPASEQIIFTRCFGQLSRLSKHYMPGFVNSLKRDWKPDGDWDKYLAEHQGLLHSHLERKKGFGVKQKPETEMSKKLQEAVQVSQEDLVISEMIDNDLPGRLADLRVVFVGGNRSSKIEEVMYDKLTMRRFKWVEDINRRSSGNPQLKGTISALKTGQVDMLLIHTRMSHSSATLLKDTASNFNVPYAYVEKISSMAICYAMAYLLGVSLERDISKLRQKLDSKEEVNAGSRG